MGTLGVDVTVSQTILALVAVFALIGVHQATYRLLKMLDGHLERLQGKLDVLLAAQVEHNAKIDLILNKLF